jgi:O-antigen/teichoic acid export membrane protein
MKMPKNPDNAPAISPLFAALLKFTGNPYPVLASIGEEALELVIALLVMILVERTHGPQGLGIYAYLTACLYAVRYLANYGVSRYVEREIAITTDAFHQHQLTQRGMQAHVITGLAGALLLLISAGFDTAHTQIQERMAAYAIIAIILPLANLNQFKLSILNGQGSHGRVALLRMLRHGIILGAMVVVTRMGLPPSYLIIAYLPAEIVLSARLRRYIQLPRYRTAFSQPKLVLETLKKGEAYLFTDNALDLLLNIDLFVLGLFVTAGDLGVYAQAAVLVRFFLIVPVALKPILRRIYGILSTQHQIALLTDQLRRNTAILFGLHAVLALLMLLYFPSVLDFFFDTRVAAARSFHIFIIFVPGLIFFGPFCAQEPIYEALERAEDLKGLTLVVAAINLILTFYLVPVAGFFGAATATMITMLIYVGLFGRKLDIMRGIDKATFLIAGFGLYLLYVLLSWLGWGAAITIWAGPMLLGLLFYACGVFGVQPPATAASKLSVAPRNG